MRSKFHFSYIVTALVTVAAIVVMALTRPAEYKHAKAVNRYCPFVDCNLHELISPDYHNHFLVSTTTINNGANKELLSVGVLSMVFVVKDLSILPTPIGLIH